MKDYEEALSVSNALDISQHVDNLKDFDEKIKDTMYQLAINQIAINKKQKNPVLSTLLKLTGSVATLFINS